MTSFLGEGDLDRGSEAEHLSLHQPKPRRLHIKLRQVEEICE